MPCIVRSPCVISVTLRTKLCWLWCINDTHRKALAWNNAVFEYGWSCVNVSRPHLHTHTNKIHIHTHLPDKFPNNRHHLSQSFRKNISAYVIPESRRFLFNIDLWCVCVYCIFVMCLSFTWRWLACLREHGANDTLVTPVPF